MNLCDPDGRLHRLVLRRYVRRDWYEREPDPASREAVLLRRLAPTSLPTPRLIAVDAEGIHCDAPAVLSERLPGQIRVAEREPDEYFSAMAGLLPVIHRVGTDPDFQRSRPYFTYADLTTLRPASWSRDPPVGSA